jgi:hypothetical protein
MSNHGGIALSKPRESLPQILVHKYPFFCSFMFLHNRLQSPIPIFLAIAAIVSAQKDGNQRLQSQSAGKLIEEGDVQFTQTPIMDWKGRKLALLLVLIVRIGPAPVMKFRQSWKTYGAVLLNLTN